MALLLFFNPKRGAPHQPILRRGARQSYQKIRALHQQFWRERPALLIALSLLIGVSTPLFLGQLIWPIVWCLYLLFCRFPLQTLILAGGLFYAHFLHSPSFPDGPASGIFYPSSVQPHASPFHKGLVYKGTFTSSKASVPCSLYFRGDKKNRPKADQIYLVRGAIKQRSERDYLLKTKVLKPYAPAWNLAELRYRIKDDFRHFLSRKLSQRNFQFLSALATGDVEDRMLRFEFGRLGLQHILAISGFHFGIVLSFCSLFFSLFLTRTWKIAFLFLAVNAYFIFVGSSASVQRSWLTALFYLLGKWMNRPTDSLNLLGCAAAAEIIFDPWVSSNIGFHLSFLSCGSILLLHPFFNRILQRFLPHRSSKERKSLPLISQHIYLLSTFFRQSISLTLAVNIALLPVLLYHFHTFPLLSLIYNLFFPFATGIALTLLLACLITELLFAPLAHLLFSLLDFLCTQLLDLVSYPPLILDRQIGVDFLSPAIVIAFLLLILFLGIQLSERLKNA